MDVRWLSAPEADVEAAIGDERAHEPPPWVPRKVSLAGSISLLVLLWYLAFVWIYIAADVEARGGWRLGHVPVVVVTMGIFALGVRGTCRLFERARQPGREERMAARRSALVAGANGFEYAPVRRAHFASLITGESRTASCYPRFTAPGVEFGNLRSRREPPLRWHYLTVTLPEPQPHLVLDATSDGSLPRDLPLPAPDQQILRGGTFADSFRVFAPRAYETDAMFLLTPEVMAALAEHGPHMNVEIRDNKLIFFTSGAADFTDPAPWHTIGALLRDVVPPIVARAGRYRDLDVQPPESEDDARRRKAFEAEMAKLGHHRRRAPSIGPVGRRLRLRRRGMTRARVRANLRNVGLFILYVTPFSVAVGTFVGTLVGPGP